jgi:hypothetical protein
LNLKQVANATVVFAGAAVDWQGKSHRVIRLDMPELFVGGVTFQAGWILLKEKPAAIARMVRRLLSRSKITDCRVEWRT